MKLAFDRASLVDNGWDLTESHDQFQTLAQHDYEEDGKTRTMRLYMPEVGDKLICELNLMNDEPYLNRLLARIKATGASYTVL